MKKGGLKQLKKNDSQPSDLSIQKGLMNIYSNKDGSLPDISHLDVRRKSRFRLYLFSFIGIGIILAAIVWLVFIVLNPVNTFSTQSI